ncbi:MAG: RagB/SusD family nutrient uptake outer membrane protein [Cytophagales bacterium]|nr:RagB/SusD family nutrient uptake outer membrane protein [Cytophagales bacterium]
MKRRINIGIGIILLTCIAILPYGCKESYLDVTPTASLNEDVLNNQEGLDALLLAAYAALDGTSSSPTNVGWQNDYTNWLYGEIAADNALKGSSIGDQPQMNSIEDWTLTPDNSYMSPLWASVYEGVSRSNAVLRVLATTEGLSENDSKRIAGEARFLRAHFHHMGRRYFNKIPYIDETVEDFRVPNDGDIFDDIRADYQFAIDNLPEDPKEVGRTHLNAARASLAKLHMDNSDYAAAKPLLEAIINSGRYLLFPNYNDNFAQNNEQAITNTEKIFEIQGLGQRIENAYLDGRLVNGIAQLHGCCGFLQPSQNLVNAHKTDENGLPLLDTFNDVDLANDQGIETNEPFTPPADNLDPRLDFTVGRRGIPYLDFDIQQFSNLPGDKNIFPGKLFVVDQATYGPYRAKKFLPTQAERDATDAFLGVSNINYSIHRYADILLLRAEVAVEENDLSTALMYVNMIRNRAKNGEVIRFEDGTPAANYVVEPYPDFPDQGYARKAVRFERRLELALEGQRWYDLVRWGIAESVMNEYFATEDRPLLDGKSYKSDFLPLPGSEIDVTRDDDGNPTLIQNPDY